jgi:hypothetical protein
MNIGFWIFLSVLLVLAVFRADFRRFLLWALAVGVVLAGLAFGGVYTYDRYKAHQQQMLAKKTETERQKAIGSCLKRFFPNIDPATTPGTLPSNWFDVVYSCTIDPSAEPIPHGAVIASNDVLPPGAVIVQKEEDLARERQIDNCVARLRGTEGHWESNGVPETIYQVCVASPNQVAFDMSKSQPLTWQDAKNFCKTHPGSNAVVNKVSYTCRYINDNGQPVAVPPPQGFIVDGIAKQE